MKFFTLLFVIAIGGIISNIIGLFRVSWYIIAGLLILTAISFYITKHKENKERRTPKPVYWAEPY